MKEQYEKPAELYDGLRLHQNENTGGCSPRVLDALARLTRQNLAYYPPYAEATEACARHLGVAADRVMLVNGLDEGIMSAAIAYLRPHAGSGSRSGGRGARTGVRDLPVRHGRGRRPARAGDAET